MKFTEGIILKGIGGFYYVDCGGEVFETRACGRFRKEHILPYVGDRVMLSENHESVVEILPRKCEFVRPPVSNIDQMLIVASITAPPIDTLMIDSLLLTTEFKGIDAVVCISKSDLDNESECEKFAQIYQKAGYRTLITSLSNNTGLSDVESILKGKITALAGNSGVGKSSLLNYIAENLELETGTISRKLARGKHTTRHVELFSLNFGGFVLDTPGFSRINLPEIIADKLPYLYREMRNIQDNCRFKGCCHINEPDCAVKEAVHEGIISAERYENYKYFYEKMKYNKEWKFEKDK